MAVATGAVQATAKATAPRTVSTPGIAAQSALIAVAIRRRFMGQEVSAWVTRMGGWQITGDGGSLKPASGLVWRDGGLAMGLTQYQLGMAFPGVIRRATERLSRARRRLGRCGLRQVRLRCG